MIKLSILIPCVFERQQRDLFEHVLGQARGTNVEVLALFDNRKRSLGHKRNVLVGMALGRYLCHLDDDDWVANDYVMELLQMIGRVQNPDVIMFDQEACLDGGEPFRVVTGLEYENEQGSAGVVHRKPWTWCCWRTDFVRGIPFEDDTRTEDYTWLKKVWPRIGPHAKIEKVLHYYRYSRRGSLAS